MKFHFVVCAGLLSLGGCGLTPPSAPRVPPLPKGPVTPVPKLAADDAVLLQQINLRAAYMKAATDLAALHSGDELIKGFAAQQSKDYDKLHADAQKVATAHTLLLVETQSGIQQKRLATLGRSYGRPFDRALLYALTHASTARERAALAQAKKSGSTADMKSLAGTALDLLNRSQEQGLGLIRR
ncbi:DUF4142 domain-containing protein [Bombella apis]|uniref:DUF4142 domain-containing protein n=1 Tax=Bombella apis TaxID=1785988 RepID=UPI0012B6F2B9|nr:DUF4142 domain-containing protein [Bombella apis]MCL1563547.1 DUF4142 domain-containing protein [Parasaccharibacter sp. TMW 2.1886]MPV99010.1 DUF4142 domain-containing protein [Bombella apis]